MKDKLSRAYIQYALNHPFMGQKSLQDKAYQLPVCPKCERMVLRHREGVRCVHCGYEGKSSNVTVLQHWREV